mgnify:CR=1 FL=1
MKKQFKNADDEGCEFYMTVMVPDKPVADEGDDGISFVRMSEKRIIQTYQNAFDIDSDDDYHQFIQYIKNIYVRISHQQDDDF